MLTPLFQTLLLRSTYITAGMLLLWLGLDTTLSGVVWAGMSSSKSALTGEYCELNHVNRLFHQPINTYSNLAYFFLGVFITQLARQDYQNRYRTSLNRLEAFPMLSVFVGLCFVYLGLGSAFFHASLTYVGQRVDMNGTYGVMVSLVGVALYHVLYPIKLTPSGKVRWVLALVFIVGTFWSLWSIIPSARLVPALILLLTLLMLVNYIQFRHNRSILFVVLSFMLTIIAVKIRTMDVQKVNCDPYSFFQGHAWWHVLTSLSSFCSYAFFRFTGGMDRR